MRVFRRRHSGRRSILEREREVMRSDLHALVQIEAVRIEALHAGIERERFAIFAPRFLDEPVEQLAAVALRAIGLARDEIIDVERPPRKKQLEYAIAGHSTDLVIALQETQPETLAHL